MKNSGRAAPRLRVALIGAGRMGANHLRAIAGCRDAEIVGIADPKVDVRELGRLVPESLLVAQTAEDLFERARPDVVHIVTPPRTHAELALAALARGVHAYVEKPFTETVTQAETLLRSAAEQGLAVCPGHQCLFDRAAILGRRLLPMLGTIVHVQSYFAFRTVRRGIRPVDQAKDILPHAVYMLLDFMRRASPSSASEPVSLKSLDVSADGTTHALLGLGSCRGSLIVTLTGRPVAQYVDLVGTNGCARIDLVSGSVLALPGPGANAVAAMLEPYRRGWQLATGATAGFADRFRERKYGYPGLRTLLSAFYEHVSCGSPAPVKPAAILETVGVCELIGRRLDEADTVYEQEARAVLVRRELDLPAADPDRGTVLVTGASGFLGQAIVAELRDRGWRVRGVARQPVPFSARIPGVEYVTCDLSERLPAEVMAGIQTVVHCAAETRGGKKDQERNSVQAGRMVVEAAADAGVRQVIHISSVAVMKPGPRIYDEECPVDEDGSDRGPYVWGKAASERLIRTLARERSLRVRVIRLGPLVRPDPWEAPGRLGRELGPLFVAVGPKRARIALIDVAGAAAVVRLFVEDVAGLPDVANLVEPDSPTRAQLVARLRASRPDLKVVWVPFTLLRLVGAPLVWLQRILGRRPALDIASAFVGPRYRTQLAEHLLQRAGLADQGKLQAASR